MKRSICETLNTRAIERCLRSFYLFAALTLSILALPATPAAAGESSVEIPIPAAIEQGLEQAGIRIETKRSWLDDSTVLIGGSIIVAGLIIAYALRRHKT